MKARLYKQKQSVLCLLLQDKKQNRQAENTMNDIPEPLVPNKIEEQSYIENILRLNKGKKVKAYVSFPDSSEWKNKIFEGTIKEAGRDHLIIMNNQTGEWYLILMIYLNYVEFEEKINYSHDYSDQTY